MPEKFGSSINQNPPVIDYEGSHYRTEFWEGQGRQYEDATERLALQRLLPATGKRIAELGAGFGRLANLYDGYEQVVLFDYSRTLLREAVERWGQDRRYIFVAGNVYDLPLASASLDTLVMIRVMHHLAHVPKALSQIHRVLHRQSVAVVEYANKRNAKAVARFGIGRQRWSPFDQAPVEFVKLNFDFHPVWMWEQFQQAQLMVRRQLAVSHFRLQLLKRLVPAQTLARVDSLFFGLGVLYPLAPSVFVQLAAKGGNTAAAVGTGEDDLPGLFLCPKCQVAASLRRQEEDLLLCELCGARYARHQGIWDFKEAVE
jgi:SAM-dependent methyltransferase